MGKKNKRKATTDDTTSQKRSKTSGSPPVPPKLPEITYEDMPDSHKKKFYIYDDCGSLKKYVETISWLRTMACFDGSVFEEIPNMNLAEHSYPLVEIEVVNTKDKSAKFLICKDNMYLIAFYANSRRMQFKCGFEIKNFDMLKEHSGRYIGDPWNNIGPKCMTDAIDDLNSLGLQTEERVKACEVFHIHFSEAARYYPIESLVCKSLSPVNAGNFSKRTFEDEEMYMLGGQVSDKDDIYDLVKGDGPIDFDHIFKTPEFIRSLVKKYNLLSKVWYVYSLTDKRLFNMTPTDATRFHIRSIKSLRCTLAVLCNVNLDKVIEEWEKKCLRGDETVTLKVYKEMERKVRKLKADKKVLVAQD